MRLTSPTAVRPLPFLTGAGLGVLLGIFLLWQLVNFQLGIPNPDTLNLRDAVQFKDSVARHVTGRKILVCAASSALLGIRADLITHYTGIETINLGVAGALGLPMEVAWAKKLLRPGDVVLLAFEYNLYDWQEVILPGQNDSRFISRYNIELADYLVAYDPDTFRSLSLLDRGKVLLNLENKRILEGDVRKLERSVLHHSLFPAINSQGFNEFGDACGATVEKRPPHASLDEEADALIQPFPSRPAGFEALSDFIEWCHQNQIQVLATWPNLLDRPEYHLSIAQNNIERIAEFYRLHHVPVVGSYEESLRPKEDFFDTIYHLTETAARDRTTKLLMHWPREIMATPDTTQH